MTTSPSRRFPTTRGRGRPSTTPHTSIPATTYKPWVNGGGYTFSDSPPTAARFDPVFGTAANAIDLDARCSRARGALIVTRDAARHRLPGVATNYYFRVQTGMVIPAGTCMQTCRRQLAGRSDRRMRRRRLQRLPVTENGVNVDYTLTGNSGVAIRYFPATFYLSATTGLPTGFGYTGHAAHRLRAGRLRASAATRSSPRTSRRPRSTTPRFRTSQIGSLIRASAIRRCAPAWARRSQTSLAMRVAGFTINSATGSPPNAPNVTVASIDNAATRNTLYQQFYRDFMRSGGTPNRPRGVQHRSQLQTHRRERAASDTHARRISACCLRMASPMNLLTGDGFYSLGNIDGTYGDP